MGDWYIGVFAFVMIRVNATKHNFTSFTFITISVEPKGKNWLLDQALFYHVIPVMKETKTKMFVK